MQCYLQPKKYKNVSLKVANRMKHKSNHKPAEKVRNQIHKPLKRKYQLGAEQEKVMMFYKIGKCTMPIGRMTKLNYECLKANIARFVERNGDKLEGTFFAAR